MVDEHDHEDERDNEAEGIPALDERTQAALDALEEKLNRPVGWVPAPGDRVAGKAVSWETIVPYEDEKKRCEVLTLATRAGLVTVWAYNKQLRTKLIKPGIDTQAEAEAVPHDARLARIDDLVAIEFVGKFPHPENEGQSYKRFRVEIDRQVAVPPESDLFPEGF